MWCETGNRCFVAKLLLQVKSPAVRNISKFNLYLALCKPQYLLQALLLRFTVYNTYLLSLSIIRRLTLGKDKEVYLFSDRDRTWVVKREAVVNFHLGFEHLFELLTLVHSWFSQRITHRIYWLYFRNGTGEFNKVIFNNAFWWKK